MKDETATAWLCIYAFQLHVGADSLQIPDPVVEDWVRRGWVRTFADPDDSGLTRTDFTGAGMAVVDLHSADWACQCPHVWDTEDAP